MKVIVESKTNSKKIKKKTESRVVIDVPKKTWNAVRPPLDSLPLFPFINSSLTFSGLAVRLAGW